jgi:hypothetical protein
MHALKQPEAGTSRFLQANQARGPLNPQLSREGANNAKPRREVAILAIAPTAEMREAKNFL